VEEYTGFGQEHQFVVVGFVVVPDAHLEMVWNMERYDRR